MTDEERTGMSSRPGRAKFLSIATTVAFILVLAISAVVGLLTNLLLGAVVTLALLGLWAWTFSARRPWWGIPPADVDALVARRAAMTDAERSAARRTWWWFLIGLVAVCFAIGLIWGYTQS